MPAIYLWEYKIGYWAMHGHLPRRFNFRTLSFRDYVQWETFFTVGRPLFIGSLIIGLPSAAIVYFICRGLVTSHRARARAEEGTPEIFAGDGTGVASSQRSCRLLSSGRRRRRSAKPNYEILYRYRLQPLALFVRRYGRHEECRVSSRAAPTVDAKDFGSRAASLDELRGGSGQSGGDLHPAHFASIPAIFRGDEAASDGEMPIRKALDSRRFCEDLERRTEQDRAVTRVSRTTKCRQVGWLVEGQFDLVDGGDPAGSLLLRVHSAPANRCSLCTSR